MNLLCYQQSAGCQRSALHSNVTYCMTPSIAVAYNGSLCHVVALESLFLKVFYKHFYGAVVS